MNSNKENSPSLGQIGLAFGDEESLASLQEQAPVKPARKSRKPEPVPPTLAVSPQAGPPAEPLTAEAMAQTLDAHPDYRVLRRLVPCLDFGPAPANAEPATLLVLDTETTGLDASKERIIELALLRVTVDRRTGRPYGPVQVYDGLEDPGRPLPPEIVQITGITDAMLAGQRLDETRVAQLAQGVDLVVAHNAGFDRPFVESRCPVFASLAWACSWADLDWKAMGQGSAKLESLAFAQGLFYDAHRAETDCHALLAVLNQPLAALQPEGTSNPASDPTRLARLLAESTAIQYRLQATGAPFDAKDDLKARGYRWDGQQRVWGTTLRSEAALQDELAWLKEAVYGGRAVRVRVEAVNALQRYSTRPGACTMLAVGDRLDALTLVG